MKLSFKVYMNGSKWKSLRLNSIGLTLQQVYKKILKADDFEFLDTSVKQNDLTEKFIISMIKVREENKSKFFQDQELVNRIIQNGGFINYIKELEKCNTKS